MVDITKILAPCDRCNSKATFEIPRDHHVVQTMLKNAPLRCLLQIEGTVEYCENDHCVVVDVYDILMGRIADKM